MKKQCYFTQNGIKHIDFKNVELLKKFLGNHAEILPREKTGISAKYQRQFALAVKRARFMGLLPFVAK